MKQFLVFVIRTPKDPTTNSGGWHDYLGDFDTATGAYKAAMAHCHDHPEWNFQVVDTSLQKVIDVSCD